MDTQNVNIGYSDSQAVDAFERLRVANPIGIFENKNIHSRNKNQWEEPIVGAIIEHGAVTSGPFQVAETITGGTSGTIGTVTAVNGGSLTVTYTVNHDDFVVGEEITGGVSGATADITTVGTGSTITHDRNNASAVLQVGAGSGDSAVRTSHRYLPYVPGKSQEIFETFKFGTAVAGVRRRVGYFDPDNGIFLEQTNAGLRITIRTKTSGSMQEFSIEQANWSENTFLNKNDSEKNPSNVVLDFKLIQFLYIDFQWQGTGRVRIGFYINGRKIDAHHCKFSNHIDTVYMSTPSLPVRYEITNTAATTGTNTMREFCTSVVSNGGETLTGVGFSISNDILGIAVTTAERPILLLRLLSSAVGGGPNRKTIQLSNSGIFATGNAAHFELSHLHDPDGISTATTWIPVGGGSEAEYSVTTTAITGNPQHKVEEGYAGSGQAGKGSGEKIEGDKLDQHRLVTQNVDSNNSEVFMLSVASLTGTSTVYGHMSFIEFE